MTQQMRQVDPRGKSGAAKRMANTTVTSGSEAKRPCPLVGCIEKTSTFEPPAPSGADALEAALSDFCCQLHERSQGLQRTGATAKSYAAAVRKFMSALTKTDLEQLEFIGKNGGVVDSIKKGGKMSVPSLRTYLYSLAKFLAFLATSTKWVSYLDMTSSTLETLRGEVVKEAISLRREISRQAETAANKDPEETYGIKPWMTDWYLHSDEVSKCHEAIQRAAMGDKMDRAEFCQARNSLIVQLLLSNSKKAGDLTSLEKDDVFTTMAEETQEGGKKNKVEQHEEAESCKDSPLRVNMQLLEDLAGFARHISPETSPLVFTTFSGEKITSSNMSKIVDHAWRALGNANQVQLPKLTSSIWKKMADSTRRKRIEEEGRKEMQKVLRAYERAAREHVAQQNQLTRQILN